MNKIIKFTTYVFFPLVLFTLVTFVFFSHLFKDFNSHIEGNDGQLLAWTVTWNNHKLLTDPLGIFDANIYYPNDNTLTYSEHFIGGSILALPVHLITDGNPVASFNFIMILCYILNAFAAYLLTFYLTKRQSAGIIAGLIFAFCSYRIFNFVHLQNMPVFYMPLLVLFFYKYLENKKIQYLIGIGAMLLIQSLTSWYHMIFIFLLFGLLVLYHLAVSKELNWKDIRRFIVMGVIVVLLILPFAIPYFQFQQENDSAYKFRDLREYSADLGGYFLPSPQTFTWNEVFSRLNIQKGRWLENFNFIGYVPLLLSIYGLLSFSLKLTKGEVHLKFKPDKKLIVFALIGIVFFILSLGPVLHLNDQYTRIPLPYIFIYFLLPPLRFIRAVARYSTVVFMVVSVLSGFGFVKLLDRMFVRLKIQDTDKVQLKSLITIVLTGIVGAVILFEFYPYKRYYPLEDVSKVPEIYMEIKDNEEVEALLVLPINVGPFTTTDYIYYSGIHFKPIVNGYSGFEPEIYPYYKNIFSEPNDIAVFKLHEIGVTHILVMPAFEDEIVSDNLTLIREIEGYRLYEINNSISSQSVYHDDFSGNTIKNGDIEVEYIAENINLRNENDTTPISNISPVDINTVGTFTVISSEVVDDLWVKFRAYSQNDFVSISCNDQNYVEVYSNTSSYLEDYLRVEDCNSSEIKFILYSTEFPDRAMLTSIGLTFN